MVLRIAFTVLIVIVGFSLTELHECRNVAHVSGARLQ